MHSQQVFLTGLSDDDLNATLHYKTTRGTPMSDVLWHLLVHVVNHGTQHRSEAAILLTTYGRSPRGPRPDYLLREGR